MAARRVVERYGVADTLLLFADTKIEDADAYRFLDEAAANVGAELVKIAEGRDPWQVFNDRHFLSNSRVDHCSQYLKRDLLHGWMVEHFTPETATLVVGIDWTEEHRLTRLRERRKTWQIEAPMCEPPYLTKVMMLDELAKQGIEIPKLYRLGFAHNNCGGFCVKAGIGHFVHLLRTIPDVYAYHEGREQEIRRTLGNVAILKDRRGGTTRPMTLKELRERVQANEQFDMFDVGGCGCAVN
jgi:hypothetical protein